MKSPLGLYDVCTWSHLVAPFLSTRQLSTAGIFFNISNILRACASDLTRISAAKPTKCRDSAKPPTYLFSDGLLNPDVIMIGSPREFRKGCRTAAHK